MTTFTQDILSLEQDLTSVQEKIRIELGISITELQIKFINFCTDYFRQNLPKGESPDINTYCEIYSAEKIFVELNLLYDFCYKIICKKESNCKDAKDAFCNLPILNGNKLYEWQSAIHKYSLISSYYTLLDQSREEVLHQTYEDTPSYTLDVRRITSIENSLPENIINTEYSSNKGINYREFLTRFDKQLMEKHSANKTFLNCDTDLRDLPAKRLNSKLIDFVNSLFSYYTELLEPCFAQDCSLIDRLLYFYKLESIFGVTLFCDIFCIFNNNESSNIDERFSTFRKAFNSFNKMPLVFGRKSLLDACINGDLYSNDISYLTERFIPLVTNTFFCLLNYLYKDYSIDMLLNYLTYCLTEPSKENKTLEKISVEIVPENVKNFYKYMGSLHPYYHWKHIIAYISSDFSKCFLFPSKENRECPSFINVLKSFNRNANNETKRKVLTCLFERYTKKTWIIPSSKLP